MDAGLFSPLQMGRLVPAWDRCVGSLRCRSRPEYRSSWFVCRRSRHASFGFRLVRSWGNCQCVSLYGGCRVPRPAGYSSEVHRYVPTCRRCPRLSREYWALYVPWRVSGVSLPSVREFQHLFHILRCRSRDKSVSTGRLHWWDACRLPTCFHPSYRAMCSSLMNCSNFLINRFVLLLSGILFCLYMMPDMPISIIQWNFS